MRIRIAPDQVEKLRSGLQRAGEREIGGQLYGEQLAPSHFRVTELTIQRRPGTVLRFVVDLVQAAQDAFRFFASTGHNYTRFNYVGEWHSHPKFRIIPSCVDETTMRDLVCASDFPGMFAVLMIARLEGNSIEIGAWVFDGSGGSEPICVEMEK